MKILKNNYVKAFLISFGLGFFMLILSIIFGNGIVTLIDDLNMQQIPFNELMNYSIKEGNIFWTWYNDLGSNFIGTFSFYNLASPFVLLGFLFPASFMPYLIGPLYMLKYGVAGLTSFMFMRRYVKNEKWALLGSLLYSFSGFQITNMLFFHFHDVVAFFPLLLYSLDRLVLDNKKFLFCLCVALSAFTNYFFFIGQVLFLIIYYIVRVITKSYNFTLKSFGRIVFEGFLGTGIAMVILLPSLLFVIDNPRVSNNWDFRSMFFYDRFTYIDFLRSLIFPSEVMTYKSSIMRVNFGSVDTFLPLAGSVFVFAYLYKKKKDWISILFILCLIFMFVPFLNSSFVAFTYDKYARWFFMLILIMSLMSAKCLDEGMSIKPGIIITIILFGLFGLSLVILKYGFGNQVIYNKEYFLVYLFTFIICLVLTFLIMKYGKHKYLLLMLGIFIYVVLRGNYFFYQYKGTLSNDPNYINNFLTAKEIKLKDKSVRTDSSDKCNYNVGYLAKIPNIKVFNSNLNGSNFEFYKSVGIPNNSSRQIHTYFSLDEKNLHNFLSVKYLISCGEPSSYWEENYKLYKKTNHFYIYENSDYKKMGISYNYYISANDFNKLDFALKREILNKAIVLNDLQIQKYKSLFNEYQNDKDDYINELSFNEFIFGKGNFTNVVKTDRNTLILYTVPYDKGWKAYVNGKFVDILKVDNGFMAVPIAKGKNEILFNYVPLGFKEGLIISILSIVIMVINVLYIRKPRK